MCYSTKNLRQHSDNRELETTLARYIIRRVLYMVPTLLVISFIVFSFIQLPPGDYLSAQMAALSAEGEVVDQAEIAMLTQRYGLDQPFFQQYWTWLTNMIFHGDLGQSFELRQGVVAILKERVPLTALLTFATILLTWIVAFPIGLYSAVKQYSFGDYVFTTLGFLGLAVPNFLIALVLMYLAFKYFGLSTWGLFSDEYYDAPWSFMKFLDLLSHFWVPLVVLGTAGTAGLIRTLRANLLDELRKPYVVAARARGVSERKLIIKYPVRVAVNPFFSFIGLFLPALIGGEVLVSKVLGLPTMGPILLDALISQDMYLAGSVLMVGSVLTVIGVLVSDIALAWLDPRIRYQYR